MDMLESLLQKNYERLTEQTGRACIDSVVNFMRCKGTVSGRNILFIKRLTKVAHHIVQVSNELNGWLDMIYQFNMEGVKKLRTEPNMFTEYNSVTLESHLWDYAGDAAKACFELSGDVSWAEKRYDCYSTSADVARLLDPKHSAYVSGFAGNAAKVLFELSGDVSWAKKWYGCYSTSADMTRHTDPKHSAHAYGFAGNAAKACFELSGDVSWVKRWYEATKNSADVARLLDPKHSAYAYGFAGDAAKACFELSGDVSWAKKWYESTKASADMTRHTDPKHSAHTYSFAGNAANEAYKLTYYSKWSSAACACYNKFLTYYETNSDPKMSNVINRVKQTVLRLNG